MPKKDGTGPEGKGSKTGRQMGNCKNAELQSEGMKGKGCRPCGRGRGSGRRFSEEEQKE